MNVLLDTCTFLWLALDGPELSAAARTAWGRPDTECFLSSVSALEIALQHARGRLPLPERPERYVPRLREALQLQSLPLGEAECVDIAKLPPLHRDPHDRLLIAQALEHGLTLLTPDEQIARYPVRTLW